MMQAVAVRTVLHLGCGRKQLPVATGVFAINLDADARLKPDVVCCLGKDPIPLADNSVDEAVAIHVLEHIGKQGETGEWFAFWEDLYRVLKPGGLLAFESPLHTSVWAWADPSHTRVLSPESFVYLSQDSYRLPGSGISPFRISCDFVSTQPFEGVRDTNEHVAAIEPASHFRGVVEARKPLRPWWADAA